MKISLLLPALFALSVTACANDYYYEYGKKVGVVKLHESRTINDRNVHYYKINGKKVGVTDEIIVQCNDGVDCPQVLEKYHFPKVSTLSEKLFLVKVQNADDVFKLSRRLHDDKDIKLAHPNFVKQRKRR